MLTSVALRLYASTCGRNDHYISRIQKAAEALGLSYTLEHVSDEKQIEQAGLTMPCLFSYCPGCRQLNAQTIYFDPEARCTPALEVNGTLIFWGEPAGDTALRDCLLSFSASDISDPDGAAPAAP